MNLPPLLPNPVQEKTDREHLNLLVAFHYTLGGLAVLGVGFLFMHRLLMDTLLNSPDLWKSAKGGPPPAEFFALFSWVYVFMGIIIGLGLVLNLSSAFFIQRRQGRMYSLVVAGLNCTQFPFGTALGVFTFVVLLRDSVRRIYEENAARSPSL